MKIKIYQINMERDRNRVKFQSHEEMRRFQGAAEVDASIYDRVFWGDVDCGGLEDVFRLFNTEGHRLHRGHFLSVSDIVGVEGAGGEEFFFCGSVGFQKVPFEAAKAQAADNLIRILVVEPHRKPYESEVENTLRGMQRAVGGLIQCLPNGDGTALILNDEGKLNGMEGNRRIPGDVVCGPFFIAGEAGEAFCSLDDMQLAKYAGLFAEPDEDITPEETEPSMEIAFFSW